MPDNNVLLTVEDGVATLTLNRPAVMNALDAGMRREVAAAVCAAPDVARVLMLTGAGPAFCSGQDLGETGRDVERTLVEEYEPMLAALVDCPIPTIAAVNGIAAGAGANLALACDLVIAARSASFVQAFARIGLIPDAGGTWLLPRQIGYARAMGAILLAEPVGAETAAAWGMIWQAVPDEALAVTVATRARALSHGPTVAYRLAREAVRAGLANDLATQLGVEARLQGAAGRTADFTEGVAAFREKRPARFRGC